MYSTSTDPSVEPMPPTSARTRSGARITQSLDGRWLAVACDREIWLEDAPARKQTQLDVVGGDDLALTTSRLYVAREGQVESVALGAAGPATRLAIDAGRSARLAAAGASVVVSGEHGTWLVRDGKPIAVTRTPATVRAIGEARYLVLERGEPSILDAAGEPRSVRIGVTAPVLDATCVLDRSTCVLLVDRGRDQELLVMRSTGSVLARIRVRNVHRIYGAARAFLVALATADGRVIGYDLRERTVLSADRLGTSPCDVVVSPDGQRLVGVASPGGYPQLFERRLRPAAS